MISVGAREVLDAPEAHAVGRGEGGGGGAVAVFGDQLGDLALIEALAQAPRTLRARSLTWVFMFLRCASPVFRGCGRVGGRPLS
jgi:hypothetical protein